jgi:iron complex outermembrane receptor protein
MAKARGGKPVRIYCGILAFWAIVFVVYLAPKAAPPTVSHAPATEQDSTSSPLSVQDAPVSTTAVNVPAKNEPSQIAQAPQVPLTAETPAVQPIVTEVKEALADETKESKDIPPLLLPAEVKALPLLAVDKAGEMDEETWPNFQDVLSADDGAGSIKPLAKVASLDTTVEKAPVPAEAVTDGNVVKAVSSDGADQESKQVPPLILATQINTEPLAPAAKEAAGEQGGSSSPQFIPTPQDVAAPLSPAMINDVPSPTAPLAASEVGGDWRLPETLPFPVETTAQSLATEVGGDWRLPEMVSPTPANLPDPAQINDPASTPLSTDTDVGGDWQPPVSMPAAAPVAAIPQAPDPITASPLVPFPVVAIPQAPTPIAAIPQAPTPAVDPGAQWKRPQSGAKSAAPPTTASSAAEAALQFKTPAPTSPDQFRGTPKPPAAPTSAKPGPTQTQPATQSVSFSKSLTDFLGVDLFASTQPQPPQPPQPPVPPTPPPETTPPASSLGFPSLTAPSTSNTSPGGVQVNPAGSGVSTDPGSLLQSSGAAEVQRRSPIVNDPRIEGFHFGQIATYADGGYWFPARVDLDTAFSKMSSDNIQDIQVIKGPFSVRFGPGFSFLDILSLPTPRSQSGLFEAEGSSSVSYHSNGSGYAAQQSVSASGSNWGFRLSYDILAAGNYQTGNGTTLPSAYNTQYTNAAFGINLSPDVSLEMKYLHVQQSDVFLPGLLTDINGLSTDSFTARFNAANGSYFDKFVADVWINNTTFNGNSANQATRLQIPQLNNILPTVSNFPGAQPVRLDINTDGNTLSYGFREIMTWGDAKSNLNLGVDFKVLQSQYNEYDAFNFSVLSNSLPANLGIPAARQLDGGIFLDAAIPFGDHLSFKAGTRADFVDTQFLGFGPGVDEGTYRAIVGNPEDRNWVLFSGFLTGEYKINEQWTVLGGYGYAQRPPTITELYAGGAFLGLLQNGFNAIYGNPNLEREQIHQWDLGVKAKYENFRGGFNAYFALLPGYITYNYLGPYSVTVNSAGGAIPQGTVLPSPIQQFQFTNTNLATMYGFSAYGEYDVLPWLTPFALLNFVEAWDQSRDQPLPGIAPLDSRVGIRIHEPGKSPRWGVEYYARIVAAQDLAATQLLEQQTSGFVVHYVRAFWQPRENIQLHAGVDNIANLQYQEHLDLRTGDGVFQPGINYYIGAKISY